MFCDVATSLSTNYIISSAIKKCNISLKSRTKYNAIIFMNYCIICKLCNTYYYYLTLRPSHSKKKSQDRKLKKKKEKIYCCGAILFYEHFMTLPECRHGTSMRPCRATSTVLS